VVNSLFFNLIALRRYYAVGREKYGAPEGLKFCKLLPPGVAVVAGKVRILLKAG
jgi:hypothetical protein